MLSLRCLRAGFNTAAFGHRSQQAYKATMPGNLTNAARFRDPIGQVQESVVLRPTGAVNPPHAGQQRNRLRLRLFLSPPGWAK